MCSSNLILRHCRLYFSGLRILTLLIGLTEAAVFYSVLYSSPNRYRTVLCPTKVCSRSGCRPNDCPSKYQEQDDFYTVMCPDLIFFLYGALFLHLDMIGHWTVGNIQQFFEFCRFFCVFSLIFSFLTVVCRFVFLWVCYYDNRKVVIENDLILTVPYLKIAYFLLHIVSIIEYERLHAAWKKLGKPDEIKE